MSQQGLSPIQPSQRQRSPARDRIQPQSLRDLALAELQDTRLLPGRAKRVWSEIRALLSEEQIRDAAREYHARRGKLPTAGCSEKLSTCPETSWRAVDSAGSHGRRGLTKGRTLTKILAPLREELGIDSRSRRRGPLKQLLSETSIIEAARDYYAQHGRLPTQGSTKKLSTYPDISWLAVHGAGCAGFRGLSKGRTLSKILAPLREELGLNRRGSRSYLPILSEHSIIEAARDYYERHGKLPLKKSKEMLSNCPATNWTAVHLAGSRGYRGLTKGRTLAKILAPLRDELANATECA